MDNKTAIILANYSEFYKYRNNIYDKIFVSLKCYYIRYMLALVFFFYFIVIDKLTNSILSIWLQCFCIIIKIIGL